MIKKIVAIIGILIVIGTLQAFKKRKEIPKKSRVLITTIYGPIEVELYNQTPKHRDNFIKLVEEHFYDSLLFHRVINQFMIQGGDPDSKNAPEGTLLGNGGPGYDIDAEFVDSLYHKKGALAAAREGDEVNPSKKSSGSQFYIVQGQVFDSTQLQNLQRARIQKYHPVEVKNYFNLPENKELKSRYMNALKTGNHQIATEIMAEVNPVIDSVMTKYTYTPEQIATYTTIGGTPHLDDNYTVFGQVVSGLNVIDSIAQVPTDKNNRPLVNVIMKMELIP